MRLSLRILALPCAAFACGSESKHDRLVTHEVTPSQAQAPSLASLFPAEGSTTVTLKESGGMPAAPDPNGNSYAQTIEVTLDANGYTRTAIAYPYDKNLPNQITILRKMSLKDSVVASPNLLSALFAVMSSKKSLQPNADHSWWGDDYSINLTVEMAGREPIRIDSSRRNDYLDSLVQELLEAIEAVR